MAKSLEKNTKAVKSFNCKQNKNYDDNNFQQIIAPVILLAQLFGVFPICGVFAKNVKNVNFKWTNFRSIYAILWVVNGIFISYLELLRLTHVGLINAKTISSIIFMISNVLSGIFFLQLAKEWPRLIQLFASVEDIFVDDSYALLTRWSLKKKIRIISGVLLLFALTEHMVYFSSFLYDRYKQAEICEWNIDNIAGHIITTHLNHVFAKVPFNTITAIWFEYMNLSFTFGWNFMDLFIIIVSVGIATRFQQLNERLEYFHGRIISEMFWEEIRLHYVKLCELQESIDIALANIIVLACFNDLYFICLQLLNIATPRPFPINTFYFFYSLIFLIGRSSTLFLMAASINDESKRPIKVLRTIPPEGWHSETERFCHQVQTEKIALSGRKFFHLTRNIIISIAGTIITYELVLLQFDIDKIKPGMFEPCVENFFYK
ncbi:unnamed protein product [Diamesa serratosioi]